MDDWEDFINGFDDDDEDNDYEGDDDTYGSEGADGLDIPDLSSFIADVISHGIVDALYKDGRIDPENPPHIERRVISFDTVYDFGKREKSCGLSRKLLSMTIRKNTTYGSCFCCSLYEGLIPYADPLLFGLVDNVYLHCRRSYVFDGDCLSGNVRLFWSKEESPYLLRIEDPCSIKNNKAFIYLVIGDMIEEILDECEKSGSDNGGNDGNDPGDDDKGEQG